MPAVLFPEPPLSGTGFRLRPFVELDIPSIVATFRDSDTARFMPSVPRDYKEADARGWLASHEPARLTGEGLALAVADSNSDELLGCISVEIDQVHATAVLAYWLRPVARGMGYMTAAVRLVAEWLFESLEMGRIEVTTDPHNTASVAVAERVGFRKEGLIRQHLRDPDTQARLDSIIWGLLPGEVVELDLGPPLR